MSKGRIVIAEDERMAALALERSLGRAGYEIVAVLASGEEAVSAVRENPPDLVLMDLRLAGEMDGIQAAKIIHGEIDVPCIFMTAYNEETVLERSKEVGPYGYLLKPFSFGDVDASIQIALSKHRMEKEIRAGQARFRELAELLPQTVFETEQNGVFTFLNRQGLALIRHEQGRLPEGVSVKDILVPEDRERFERDMSELMDKVPPGRHEYSVIRRDGTVFPAVFYLSPMVREGRSAGVRGVCFDVTELKETQREMEQRVQDRTRELRQANEELRLLIAQRERAEEELSRSTDRYKELVRMLPVIVYELDSQGRFTFLNKAGLDGTGYSENDQGTNIAEAFVPEDREQVFRNFAKVLSGHKTDGNEYTVVRKDGTTFPALAYSVPIYADDKVVGLRGVAVDITDRKRVEEEIRKSKQTVEALLNATDDAAFLLDNAGLILALNETAAKQVGRSIEDLVGESVFGLLPQEIAERRKARFDEVVTGGRSMRYQDGQGGRSWDHRIYPVFGRRDEVAAVAVFSRDVTDRKRAQEVLLQNERIKALGEMAGGVAHNFNNLLQVLMGSAQAARSLLDTGDTEEAKRFLDRIVKSSIEGAESIRRLQDFARAREEDETRGGAIIDLAYTARHAVEMTRFLWDAMPGINGAGIRLTQRLRPGCRVRGLEGELFEVAVNLIKNAVEAMPCGGTIVVSTFCDGDDALLTVRDTGTGIPEEHQSKVFDPFWTTKGYHGIGMGLASSYGIIKSHGGEVELLSRPGEGSTFTVRLPRASGNGAGCSAPVQRAF